VGKELLVNETNTYNINAYKDSNGDGVADQKRLVYQNNAIDTKNLEHQRSGLDWNVDNWIYVTVDPVRFRYKNGMLMADSLVSGSNGQWGLTHDNYGVFSLAGEVGKMQGQDFRSIRFTGNWSSVTPMMILLLVRSGPLLKRLMFRVD
jgi:hypothetical protein